MGNLPRELSQNAHSDVREKHVPAAARYFDYGAAVALRNLAAAYGTAMPRYLLAPEVAVLLSHEPDQKKRLLIETFWNTVQPKKGERIWDVSSPDTVRSWIHQAVTAAVRDGVTFSVRPVTTKTFRDSFAMHLVPKKVIQAMMGHKDEKSTEWYTQVLALDVTRQLGVRFSMDPADARALVMPGERPARG